MAKDLLQMVRHRLDQLERDYTAQANIITKAIKRIAMRCGEREFDLKEPHSINDEIVCSERTGDDLAGLASDVLFYGLRTAAVADKTAQVLDGLEWHAILVKNELEKEAHAKESAGPTESYWNED